MEKKYISVDQLWKCETCFYMGSNGKCRSDCDAVESYRPAYSKFEFADVAPVVHGAWEEHCEEDGFVHHRCSKCRKNAFYEYKTIPLYEEDNDGEIVDCGVMKLDIIEQLTSFCPHCGAKMDEEEKHDPKG